uniref:Si:dkey-237j11.3 n=1 Tax=Oryzias melastigma TaxID=30732 RepID=A0A3B3BPS1_ORYME
MMAARIVLLFAVSPCLMSSNDNAYDRFIRHHIPPDSPTTVDETVWERFIKDHGLCERPLQSFLHPDDKNRVKAVCTKRGGKVHKGNLCISLNKFSFITVEYAVGSCRVKKTKHLILACDKVNNMCLPVHFQRNPNNENPREHARYCDAPRRWAE